MMSKTPFQENSNLVAAVFSLENDDLEDVVESAYTSNAAFFDTAESKSMI